MANVITNVGRNFTEERLVGGTTAELDAVAVGNGTGSPSVTDDAMFNQLNEFSKSSANVAINETTSTGRIEVVITVTGGNEVPSSSELSELGLKTSDGRLFYHETRSTPIIVDSGESKTIRFFISVTDDVVGEDSVITNDGIERLSKLLIGESSSFFDTVAVGRSTDTSSLSQDDSSLFDEVYRATDSNRNVVVEGTSSNGSVEVRITLSAGDGFDDEVATGTSISEFGTLTSDGVLITHEIRNEVVLQSGDTKTFSIPLNIV